MSGIMLLSVPLTLCLLWATGGNARSGAVILRDALERGPVSLNDMFREVEELMEDTQHILEEAVDQITTESAKSSLKSIDLYPNNHHQTKKMGNNGKGAIQVPDRSDEVPFRLASWQQIIKRERLIFHKCIWRSLGSGTVWIIWTESGYVNSARCWKKCPGSHYACMPYRECMVDEDCGDRKYCLYGIESSTCLPCIPTDMPCTKDEECCWGQMCVWGQCTGNASRGAEGSICQGQSDCRPGLCCAFQRELLFPVCNPKPEEGEPCLSHPNLLMDMLAWDQEGPRDHCPCAGHLQCQPQGRGSVCGE